MIFIAHRGNINGPTPFDNRVEYIKNAFDKGFHCEVDVWRKNGKLWFGHNEPKYKVSEKFIIEYASLLWLHCKNVEALQFFTEFSFVYSMNYFWHQSDDYTLTSFDFIWTFPGKKLVERSICVVPEKGYKGKISKCAGICSDYIDQYKKKYDKTLSVRC